MDKAYQPSRIEERWSRRWEQGGHFAPRGAGAGYCIMLPPPNVTGSLHMGHAFQHTLIDILIRRRRMAGDRTLWQCGTDHAGIATQLVVENQLRARGENRREMGREAFLREMWQWRESSGNTITRQMRRLGVSMDWSRERFTLDRGMSRAVREVFIRLYREGLIYRGQRLVNWDPVLRTAISDLEVVPSEESGHMWHIRYPFADDSGRYLTVATTRPETLLGDTALAVHPEDPRYRGFVGRSVTLPLAGRRIPVIADEGIDPEFGTGCVKITPAHDFNDYRVGIRHGLPAINIFHADASINDNAPPPYRGLDRYRARERVAQDLQAQGLLQDKVPHQFTVPRGDRSHAVVEPYLTDQWFVRVGPLAAPAIRAAEEGKVRFVPENWAKTYYEWMRNIQDWCISRQLWWGHRIPAWYDERGEIHVGHDETEIRQRAGLPPSVVLRQDPDVLDTWFSSALWPFSTLGWPDKTRELASFYPTSILVTGFDIIFFWVARMIMMGLKFAGDVPFREVYIHGLVKDAEGRKMSKSRGNILDPLDLIDGIGLEALVGKRAGELLRPDEAPAIERATRKQFPAGIAAYGTDSLRFTFASLATQGRDIRFDIGRIQGYRNFCNKLWNASRYVLAAVQEPVAPEDAAAAGVPERWLRTLLHDAILQVARAAEAYRFDLMAQCVHEFFWDRYCDWYLEISKIGLAGAETDDAARRGIRHTLVSALEAFLRLAHPLIPFITEELWQRVAPLAGRREPGRQEASIMLQPTPAAEDFARDPQAVREMDWLMSFVASARQIRAENNLPPAREIPVFLRGGSDEERDWARRHGALLRGLAKIERLAPAAGAAADHATALVGDTMLLVPLSGLLDRGTELKRLHRSIERGTRSYRQAERKLANSEFLERAPKQVVDKERRKFQELAAALGKLKEQRDRIAALEGGDASEPRGAPGERNA